MLMDGVKEGEHDEVLYKSYSTKVWVDVVLRFWHYAEFTLDYTLVQQFNFEYTFLQTAWDKECKHIVRLRDVFLNKDCVVFE